MDKSLLITGAAGRIGSSCAAFALRDGYRVILADISQDRLNNVCKSIDPSYLSRAHFVTGDASSSVGIENLIQESLNLTPKLDTAIHCAYPTSKGWGTKFEDITEKDLFEDLNRQLGGAILFSQKILALFKQQGGGNLVHISSIQGLRAPKFDHYAGTNMTSPAEYSTIKSGIISLTKWLARYYSNSNIRVNCVSPGGILDSQPISFLEKYRNSCTNIGMLSAETIASAAMYLVSDEACAINGHNLVVDDGWSL